ncbi:thiol:disulfide interchange protein DsbA/DsbL [Neisseria chenwenguii]|uniref:Thiol:disulfide interchange protein n=1 Tax=Neisseria chenwenguii TaxID=1853278 RepID=A0A220S3L2_9NEIS|nr:thiol:disulfide interchange protein DsbA/DsbL [Neisseria chenwenguii]ASK27982.1 disulfide bond formation protein DsbA [Neisseria chenwenguii]ROV54064.1 thiol:disulfide interchange protein DsbA/DsbL [Neisseria chenwenguii]
MKLKTAVAAFALTFAGFAQAATEGTDYTVLSKPIPQLQAGKVEVLSFFGYFCVHCNNLDPVLLKHSKTFAADTYLRPVHVVWQPEMLGLARVAAAVNSAGMVHQANGALFNAVYGQKINLADSATFKQWAAAQRGFDGKKLTAAYDNPASLAEAKKMQALTETYRISSTPTVIVGGKYKLEFPNGYAQGMKTVDELIIKVRSERGLKKR